MEIKDVLEALDALAQETRLKVFKLLIDYGEKGVAAGKISEQVRIPHNTLSFHLAQLSQAGLVLSRRQGRSIIYSANLQSIEGLISYLVDNCTVEDTKIPAPKTARRRTPTVSTSRAGLRGKNNNKN